MRFNLLLAVFLALGASQQAHAEALDKKQAGVLSRLNNQVTAAQTALAKYTTGSGPPYTERLVDDFARKVARFDEMLASLPADNDDVKKEAAHLDELRKALAAQNATLAAGTAAKAETKEKIVALAEASSADVESMKQLGEMFQGYTRYGLDFYGFARWPSNEIVVELRGWSEGWPTTQKRYAELLAKYEEVSAYRGHLEGKASMAHTEIVISLRHMRDHFPEFKEALEKFTKEAPAQIDKDAATLKAESDRAVASKEFGAFINPDGKIESLRNRLTNMSGAWGPLVSEDQRKAVDARVADALAQADTSMEKLATEIIRENKGPKDAYTGGDRAKIESLVRQFWAKEYPKESIVAIRITGSAFDRSVAWHYDAGARAFVKSDTSYLPVRVVVKDGPKQGIAWPCGIQKLHLRGDELRVSWPPRPSRGAPPAWRLFLANL